MGNFIRFGPPTQNPNQPNPNPNRRPRQSTNPRQRRKNLNNSSQNIPREPPPPYVDSTTPAAFTNSKPPVNISANRPIQNETLQNPEVDNIIHHQQEPNLPIPSAPPSYEIITNQHIQQINSQLPNAETRPTRITHPSNCPTNTVTLPPTQHTSQIIVQTNTLPHRRRINGQRHFNNDDYSDDPSDYESDHNGRLMDRGYYGNRDYYDKDEDYIYYKTRSGHRYKQYR